MISNKHHHASALHFRQRLYVGWSHIDIFRIKISIDIYKLHLISSKNNLLDFAITADFALKSICFLLCRQNTIYISYSTFPYQLIFYTKLKIPLLYPRGRYSSYLGVPELYKSPSPLASDVTQSQGKKNIMLKNLSNHY